MKQYLIATLVTFVTWNALQAQDRPADTVIINVGEASKVTFEIRSKKDLQTLKQYDFQAVVNDLISKLEQRDSTSLTKPSEQYIKPAEPVVTIATEESVQTNATNENASDDWDKSWQRREYKVRRSYKGTYGSLNFDLGMNNYLSDGKFPNEVNAEYTVKPIGSWVVGINIVERSRVARTFFVEWGGGVSWYNFKFQNTKMAMAKDDAGVTFAEDVRDLDFKKSKLTVCYLNASLVPMLDFGGNRRKSMFFDSRHSRSVRFGAGPYVGYLIDSYTKQVFVQEGDKHKERNHDSYYLENLRYGLRAQFGFKDVDLFFTYDMNELFLANKGPKLNAFSFGLTL